MKVIEKETRMTRKMSRQAMKKAKGGSQVGGLIFSSFRDSTHPDGSVRCEHSGNIPEPRQGPLQGI